MVTVLDLVVVSVTVVAVPVIVEDVVTWTCPRQGVIWELYKLIPIW